MAAGEIAHPADSEVCDTHYTDGREQILIRATAIHDTRRRGRSFYLRYSKQGGSGSEVYSYSPIRNPRIDAYLTPDPGRDNYLNPIQSRGTATTVSIQQPSSLLHLCASTILRDLLEETNFVPSQLNTRLRHILSDFSMYLVVHRAR